MAFIATTLIVIDVTLAALFWSWGAADDIMARPVKKTLFVGVFAYIIGNWNNLARIVFESFAGLGLKASGIGFTVEDLMRPGRVAQTGLDAGRPLLDSISNQMGWIAFFENFIQIACLLFAWALVLLAFFILAIQLFVTLIEFKLTTLAGFVLIPFGLFGKSAFMAERVLGNVISSGIKVLVLAVIIGIGSTLFSQFTAGFAGQTPTIDQAMAIVLAALSLLGLGIFGPGIASGALIYALQTRDVGRPAEELYSTDNRSTADGLAGLPRDYGGVPQLGPPLPGDLGRPILGAQNRGQPLPNQPDPGLSAEEQRRLQEIETARVSRLFSGTENRPMASTGPGAATIAPPSAPDLTGLGLAPPPATPSAQDRQLAFLNAAADRRTVAPDRVAPPASPYILQAGAVIAAALITGIHSDLPGQITAQVTENIYDSPTGPSCWCHRARALSGSTTTAFSSVKVACFWSGTG